MCLTVVLSVGFGLYPALPNETAFQRKGWQGWHNAGAKAQALRPNSLWGGYSSAPYPITEQLLSDVVFVGQRGLYATDFDANLAQCESQHSARLLSRVSDSRTFPALHGADQAVGPTYYALGRALWNPAKANTTVLLNEYYSAYGCAAQEMKEYWSCELQCQWPLATPGFHRPASSNPGVDWLTNRPCVCVIQTGIRGQQPLTPLHACVSGCTSYRCIQKLETDEVCGLLCRSSTRTQ